MKNPRTWCSAIVLASASLATQAAYASNIPAASSTAIELISNSASFSNKFTGGQEGQTFSDRYLFTTATTADLNADLSLRAGNLKHLLNITGFSLYSSAGDLMASSALAKDIGEIFTLSVDNLAAGSYFLQIDGSLRSNAAARYFGSLAVDIPEPAGGALMLGGLALLGMAVRRRGTPAARAS
jgi:hypothetical protein